jgi:hypothetical protein
MAQGKSERRQPHLLLLQQFSQIVSLFLLPHACIRIIAAWRCIGINRTVACKDQLSLSWTPGAYKYWAWHAGAGKWRLWGEGKACLDLTEALSKGGRQWRRGPIR